MKQGSHWLVNRLYTIAVMQSPTKAGTHQVGPQDYAAPSSGGGSQSTTATLGKQWLLVIVGLIGLALLFPLGLGIASAVRSRRSRKRYNEGRRNSCRLCRVRSRRPQRTIRRTNFPLVLWSQSVWRPPRVRPAAFLSSPRGQRRLILISSAVFLVGLIAFISTYVLRGTSGIHSPISTLPAQTHAKVVKAPPAKEALRVARSSSRRQSSARTSPRPTTSWGRRQGNMSRAEFEKGNIPVQPYPARNTKTAAFTVDWSYQTQIMLEVDLVAKKGSGANIRPHFPYTWGSSARATSPTGGGRSTRGSRRRASAGPPGTVRRRRLSRGTAC